MAPPRHKAVVPHCHHNTTGEDLEFAIKFGFKASNNEAEYEALVIGMRMAHETGAKHLLAYSDSQLVVKQVEGTYEAKEKIPREENAKADSLSKLASSLEDCRTRHITIHYSLRQDPPAVQPITTGEDWRTPIIKWIEEGLLPENRWEAARLNTSHSLRNTRTYPLQEVIYAPSAQMVLLANHEARCDPISKQVREMPKTFLSHTSASKTLTTMLSPCPFIQWGMDIVGPFPLATGQRKFLLVAIDYFTKWVEAEPLARITEGEAKVHHSAHPQANGQVEVTNRILIQGIKRRLERVGENWAEELTSVLWAYRTTPRGSTGETPFSLVYGTEAIIPAELGIPLIGS
ncbi:UNVERIFIED_CONTAM: hypothetical protein Slati_3504900 [Sesamum latifolium]|uniref:RNase H type-1 domain-containing protein n=1 Tax=Sesamum latifolium TaxID=2727402 RepID=A0AAW2UKK1_9LAMI